MSTPRNFYRAREQDAPPYLVFDLVATTVEDYERLRLSEDPLVVDEAQLINPTAQGYIGFESGICLMRVQNNELVARNIEDVNEAKTFAEQAERLSVSKETERALEEGTFVFDATEFPMDPGAVRVYEALFNNRPETFDILSKTGIYNINLGNIDAFKQAFYDKVLWLYEMSQPPAT